MGSKAYILRKSGYVYVLEAEDGLIKVGGTAKIIDRIKQLSKNGKKLRLLASISATYNMYLEKFLHIHLERFREYNEWYRNEDILERILSFVDKHGEVFGVTGVELISDNVSQKYA